MTVTSNRLSANHWPGLDQLPTGPRSKVAARIARRLFLAAVKRLDVHVLIGDTTYGKGGPVAVIHRPEEFFARLGRDQLIGFGEAYLTGAWDAEDLGGFLTVLSAEMQDLVPKSLQKLRSVVVSRPPRRQVSSKDNSQDNIAHHYDLSNDLFEIFLDPTLSYSSAYFADPTRPSRGDLEDGQGRKIERLLDQAGVGQGTRVLEIGSGWASSRCAPPVGVRPSGRSRSRWSRSCSPSSAWPPRASATRCRWTCATTATWASAARCTTPSCRSR